MINKTDISAEPPAMKDCSVNNTDKQRSDGRFYQVQPQRGAARLRVRYREGTTRDSGCRLCR
ncbi:hypothetical protein [Thalassolituus hydrocarboniclasticus]|uniref:Uncharacterized protein n=1 Tax=Thalassolituus hydrocarboniclasticus TaxID=2742796 RepID=A0ABY6ABV8_9GAMM|nr:hypothetical protein [Thalassolituus hydrocarboniclasticus]UXD87761.1 hypothetical protein HUF19_10075 [Thalassolituus hydrocarboniclasticus]